MTYFKNEIESTKRCRPIHLRPVNNVNRIAKLKEEAVSGNFSSIFLDIAGLGDMAGAAYISNI